MLAVIFSVFFVFVTVYPFDSNVIFLTFSKLPQILFNSKEAFASASGFNFWFLIFGQSVKVDIKIWRYLIFTLIHLYLLKFYNFKQQKQVFYALFIISSGGWFFLSNMYERYLYLGIVSGLVCTIYNKRLLPYWIFFSFIYLINLINSWIFPPQLIWLQDVLHSNDFLIAKILTLINIGLYLRMVNILHQEITNK